MTSELTAISSRYTAIALSIDAAKEYIAHAKAENTIKGYHSDWKHFETWCRTRILEFLPANPETVALYIADLANSGYKVATLSRRLAAIGKAHQAAGHDSPTSKRNRAVSEVWAGIRRVKGTAPTQKVPVTTDRLKMMLKTLPKSLRGARDRALLLLGFAGAFRRSELVSLTIRDLVFCPEGLTVTLRKSKTDQEGEGRRVGIPCGRRSSTCPVRSVRAWLEASLITEGPLFRSMDRYGRIGAKLSDRAVAIVVKRCAKAAGFDPSEYSGHSLRAGLATAAAIAGVSERSIMKQTGHRSTTMVRRYIRDASLFRDNAASSVGL